MTLHSADSVVHEQIAFSFQDSGVTFCIRGSEYTFRGTISLFPADNLASQYVGGYKALNAALRKCRHCLCVQKDMQSKVYVTGVINKINIIIIDK